MLEVFEKFEWRFYKFICIRTFFFFLGLVLSYVEFYNGYKLFFVYLRRTHSQISQVIREYRKTAYRVPMAVLVGLPFPCQFMFNLESFLIYMYLIISLNYHASQIPRHCTWKFVWLSTLVVVFSLFSWIWSFCYSNRSIITCKWIIFPIRRVFYFYFKILNDCVNCKHFIWIFLMLDSCMHLAK